MATLNSVVSCSLTAEWSCITRCFVEVSVFDDRWWGDFLSAVSVCLLFLF